jgi:hypothetical protein
MYIYYKLCINVYLSLFKMQVNLLLLKWLSNFSALKRADFARILVSETEIMIQV